MDHGIGGRTMVSEEHAFICDELDRTERLVIKIAVPKPELVQA